ncbi:gonadal somatic cell derived factor [Gasterosteus aculeatus]
MSFAFFVTAMLLGSSVAIAFVLQPSREEPSTSAVSRHSCQGGSSQSIRTALLGLLNLQAEPALPAGGLDGIREQWRTTFSTVAGSAKDTATPVASGNSVSTTVCNSTSLECCSMASEIFVKDLGWDNWVLHPASLTIVQCALCDPEGSPEQCPPSHANVQEADPQAPRCVPIAQEMVPVVYLDELSTLVISSVQLTRSCGCDPVGL